MERSNKLGVFNMFMLKQEDGKISYGGLFLCYVFPLCTMYAFYLLMKSGFENEDDTAERTAKMVAANTRERDHMLSQVRKKMKKGTRSHKKWE
jgi:hypothetical protein